MVNQVRQRSDPNDSAAELANSLESLGLFIGVDVHGDTVSLFGQVDSDDNRQAALDLAHAVANRDGLRVQDSIEVVPNSPGSAFGDNGGDSLAEAQPARDVVEEVEPEATSLDADFSDPIGTTDSEEAAAEAVPYFPPTDPVFQPSGDAGELAVVGGFSATSMDEEQEGGPFVEQVDDEVIGENVLRELREDAATTDMRVEVTVARGVVMLRGDVPSLDDAENVEAVAARTPGVVETVEELHVVAFEDDVRAE